jgi:phenylacetate-CoA ligase
LNTTTRRYYNPVIERLDRDQLEALQLRKVKQFCEFAYERSDFYRRKFKAARVEPSDIETLDDFRKRVPTTTKEEWLADQAEHPPYGSAAAVGLDQVVRLYLTSGTSGIGQEVHLLTRADIEYGGSWTYGLHWSGLEPGDGFVGTLPVGLGNLAGPDTAIHSAVRARLNVFSLGHLPAEQKLAMMRRFPPAMLFSVPAYLQRLSLLAEEQGFDPREVGLKAILLAAEPYTLEWAQRMEEFWGCSVTEMYGSTQAGCGIAFTCENGAVHNGERAVLHVLEHLIYAEIVDRASGEQVEPETDGELILTSFERVGTPVLRWATDDRVRFAPHTACDCGRPFGGFRAGEIARFDDMMKIKGVNIWPQAVDGIILDSGEVAEYQAEVHEQAEGTVIRVIVEFLDAVPADRRPASLAEMSKKIRTNIGIGMKLEEAVQPLPRFEFKVRRWTDYRLEGRARVLHVERH